MRNAISFKDLNKGQVFYVSLGSSEAYVKDTCNTAIDSEGNTVKAVDTTVVYTPR